MKHTFAWTVVLLLAGRGFADTLNVCKDFCKYATIQDAVDAAEDGDEIIVGAGVYTGEGDQVVDMQGKSVWLHSSDGPEQTIVDGEGERLGFRCDSLENQSTIIDGLTIANCSGVAGGGMYNYFSSPTVRNCTFRNNYADAGGGGIVNLKSFSTVTNCLFEGNLAPEGAGMNNVYGEVTVVNCTFSGNVATKAGGGMFNQFGIVRVLNTDFCGNAPDHITGNWSNLGGNGFYDDVCPQDTVQWAFSVTTKGEDISWTSSSRIIQSAPQYNYVWNLSSVSMDVLYKGTVYGPIDVTDLLESQIRHDEGGIPGPLPIVTKEGLVAVDIDGDGDVDMGGHVLMQIEETGFGRLLIDNVLLDSFMVDLGDPIGTVEVTIVRVNVDGQIDVETGLYDGPPLEEVHWPFEVTTQGEDFAWTSHTPLVDNAPWYDYVVDILYVAVDVIWEGYTIGPIDITDMIDPELLHIEDIEPGPLPVLLGDYQLSEDGDGDGDIDVEARLITQILENGYGECAVSDVHMGSLTFDFGPPIGEVEVLIDRIYVRGQIDAWATDEGPCIGDINFDETVDVSDLLAVIAAWGPCTVPQLCPEDIDENGVVDVSDLLAVIAAWGPCP